MNKIDRFNTLFAKYGGHVPLDKLNDQTKDRYHQQINFYTALDPNINIGIINNIDFNAIASKNMHGEFIGLFAGAITQLSMYSYLILSDPIMYSFIGDISSEKINPKAIDAVKTRNYTGLNLEDFLPNNSVRIDAAERIAECACLILYLHESAHVNACHHDLIFETFKINSFLEFNIQPSTEEESLILRSLELEADSIALMNGLNIWRRLVKRTGVHEVKGLNATQVWHLASEILIWVMSCHNQSASNPALSSHPRITTRLINMRLILGIDGEVDDEIIRSHKQHDNSITKWFSKHNFLSEIISIKDSFKDNSDKIVTEMTELKDYIEKLWPALEQFSNSRIKKVETSDIWK